jgi:hypothetical protein
MLISFIFIYLFDLGAVGLAWKMIIIQFIGVNIQLYFNSKLLKLDIKYFIWHQLHSILFFVIIAMLLKGFISFNSILLEFLINGILYTILVIILAYIFPQVFAITRDEIKNISRRIISVIKK